MVYSSVHHSQVSVNNVSLHVVQLGDTSKQSILFLHGYPENWQEFEAVFELLKDSYHLVAIDLPGIGKSQAFEQYDKRSIAGLVKDLLALLNLKDAVLVGHDAGGMITYAFIKHFAGFVSKAVIICTAIPGVEPWEQVKSNPYIWHFAFYAIPGLPEELIIGKLPVLFDYFFNSIAANKEAISPAAKQAYVNAYNTADGIQASLGWYRSFWQDEKDNAATTVIETPVLYLKGEKEFSDINTYAEGFKKNGTINITPLLVPGSGHFAPEENPEFVAEAINDFISAKQ